MGEPVTLDGPIAVLTAWNPMSKKRSEDENCRAQARLAARIDQMGLERWPAVNAPQTEWQEESFAIPQLPLSDAADLADEFEQCAFYYVAQDVLELATRRGGKIVRFHGEESLVY